jgi:hypothetical protein
MKDVTFDGMAEPGTDLSAWRETAAPRGQARQPGASIRDLVLGRHRGRLTAWSVRRASPS